MNVYKQILRVMMLLFLVFCAQNASAQGQLGLKDYVPSGLTGLTTLAAPRAVDNLLTASANVKSANTDEQRQFEVLRSEYLRHVASAINTGSDFEVALNQPVGDLVLKTVGYAPDFFPSNTIELILLEAVSLVTQ
jgi:hypothetical protein